jgi:CRP-like cAMP-binding protein
MSSLQASTANLLLRALTQADFALLEPHLKREELKLKDPIFNPNELIERVYFFESGVGSIVSEQEDGDRVEVGIYGREGMSGGCGHFGGRAVPPRVHGSGRKPNGLQHCLEPPA